MLWDKVFGQSRVAIPGIEHLLDNKRGSSNAMASSCRNSLLCLNISSEVLEQAVQLVNNDNLDLGYALIEQAATEKDGICREVQMMSLIDHPNLLQAHCSFTAGQNLWVVMPYMAGGSCLHIMKSAYPDGFEEPVISTLLCEVLKALVYLHAHGHIHRDVKASNILIDSNGVVKLADLGVSACMFHTGDRQRSRNTFVGTSCWMAPEVMQQLHGYDFKNAKNGLYFQISKFQTVKIKPRKKTSTTPLTPRHHPIPLLARSYSLDRCGNSSWMEHPAGT
ncbi:Serine/threonine-protein kinase fray2, partial [Camellia lanceoleosa]